MATAFKLIQSYRTTGLENSITIGTIPATYTDLLIVYNGRQSVVSVLVFVSYNGSPGGTSYFDRYLQWNPYFGAAPYGMYIVNSTSKHNTFSSYSSISPLVFGGGQIYIPSYRAALPKSPISDTGHSTASNATPHTNDTWGQIAGSLYNLTTAISSVTLTPDGSPTNKWVANSTIYVYGITNA